MQSESSERAGCERRSASSWLPAVVSLRPAQGFIERGRGWFRLALAASLTGGLGLIGWDVASGLWPRAAAPVARASHAQHVAAERVSFAAFGTVELDPEHVISVSAGAPGIVHRIATFEGDRVEAGALLAVIETAADESSPLAAARVRSYELVSPMRGTVVERSLISAQRVGSEGAAFKVADLDHLVVELRLPEHAFEHVSTGDGAELAPLAANEVVLPAHVTQVNANAAAVRVHVLDKERHLTPGQGVYVRIYPSAKRAALNEVAL